MGMLGYLFLGSHHDTWSAHGCRSNNWSGIDSNGGSIEIRDWQFSFVCIRERNNEYVWRPHTEAMRITHNHTHLPTKAMLATRLWMPHPQCRGTCIFSLEAWIPNFWCEICGICFVVDPTNLTSKWMALETILNFLICFWCVDDRR